MHLGKSKLRPDCANPPSPTVGSPKTLKMGPVHVVRAHVFRYFDQRSA
jgi:hypothetical protein